MEKDFYKWHKKKEQVNAIEKRPFFHRPVVIIRKFNNEICWIIPLSKTKKRNKYYFAFEFDATTTSVALVSQIRLLDTLRLSRKIGEMAEDKFIALINKIKALL